MARVLVVLPTDSYRAHDFVEAAAALGVELAIASEEAPPLGLEDLFVAIDCRDSAKSAEEMANLATTTPVDAIVAADDTGVVMAALAAERIGLLHNPPSAAAATRDKATMRGLLAAGEVAQPAYRLVGIDDDPTRVAAELGLPVVVKPLHLSASRGVIRVDRAEDVADTVERARRIQGDPNESLLVERYVAGPEVSLEGMLWEGYLEVLAIFDKPDPMEGPAFTETMFVTPSRLPSTVQDDIVSTTRRAASALGLREGPIHAELRVEGDRSVVIEVAARTIGGLCGRALTFGLLDTSLETLVLRHALGLRKPSLRRSPGASGVLMIPVPRPGRLERVDGLESVRAMPGVTSVEITAPSGASLAPAPEGDRYLGFVFARAQDPAEVEATLRRAMDAITVRIGET